MILIARLTGRCTDGAERDGGTLWHAIFAKNWKACCGIKHGRRSAGWQYASEFTNQNISVTCPRCQRKLVKLYRMAYD